MCQPNSKHLLSMLRGSCCVKLLKKWVVLGFKGFEIIIKWPGIRLSYLEKYPYYDTTQTDMNFHP
jgi:hypothetical protein